jgi:hypothetical protein
MIPFHWLQIFFYALVCCTSTATTAAPGFEIVTAQDLVPPPSTVVVNNQTVDDDFRQRQRQSDESDDGGGSCALYWYNWDVYTGRDYSTDEHLFANSIVQDFWQHSRRPFPTWNRATNAYVYQPRRGVPRFIYAPATVAPLTRCDPRSYNVRVVANVVALTGTDDNSKATANDNEPDVDLSLVVDRKIKAGQILISDCFYTDQRTDEEKNRPFHADVPLKILRRDGYCLDATFTNATGAYAQSDLPMHQSIILGRALHMHRRELLQDEQSGTYESIIRYCFGRPETDLLMLPLFPIIGNIQHDRERPNVKLQWRQAKIGVPGLHPDLFTTPFNEWKVVHEDPWVLPWLEVLTTRAIAAGEPLTMDFGPSWSETNLVERLLPDGLYPDEWLRRETRVSQWPEISTPPLAPGQVEPVRLTTGESLGKYQHRVGLPRHLTLSMGQWAQDMGLFNLLVRYVTDETHALPPMGEERHMFNGGRWWSRRFGKGWQSNLHMMSPDDDEATRQMHAALHRAGLDEVLRGVGQHFNLTSLTGYFPCFLVVSHCTHAHVHWDTDYPTMFNLILPIHQSAGDDSPELVLADDQQIRHVPYKYETEAGILLGKDGMHGTAPTDYRNGGQGNYRIAMSVSMGDFSKDDDTVHKFLASWQDPPYPNYLPNQLRHSLLERRHWAKHNASVSMGDAFVPFNNNNDIDVDQSSRSGNGRNQPSNASFVQMEVRQYS